MKDVKEKKNEGRPQDPSKYPSSFAQRMGDLERERWMESSIKGKIPEGRWGIPLLLGCSNMILIVFSDFSSPPQFHFPIGLDLSMLLRNEKNKEGSQNLHMIVFIRQ